MSRPVLTTARVRLVPMTTEHLPLLVELDSDAEVLRHLLGRARSEREARDFWGPVCADTDADALGLGWWVGFDSEDGFLGWWDLSPGDLRAPQGGTGPSAPTDPHGDGGSRVRCAEAGWRLARRHWRRGLATEGAAALLDHGHGPVGLDLAFAETMAVNLASRGVMAKLGMRHVRTDHREWDDPLPGAEQGEVVYEITREEWWRRRGGA